MTKFINLLTKTDLALGAQNEMKSNFHRKKVYRDLKTID